MYHQSALVFGLFCASLIRLGYVAVHIYLTVHYVMYTALPMYRRMYVQKNIVKSVCLALMLPPAVYFIVYPIWAFDVWHTYRIHYFAVLYGANDFVGLVCVDKLPKTTRIHHVVSTCLVLTSLGMDFQTSPMAQSMLVYTFFAASSYIVNYHLAVRWLFKRGEKVWLRRCAAGIYALCCAISWSWQLMWLYRTPLQLYHYVYIALMFMIVRDDIILMQWLTTI